MQKKLRQQTGLTEGPTRQARRVVKIKLKNLNFQNDSRNIMS